MPSTSRRAFLGTMTVGTVIGIAGCSSSCPDTDTPEPSHTVESADDSGFDTLPGGSWPAPRFDTTNAGYAPIDSFSSTPSVQWQTTVPTDAGNEDARTTGVPLVVGETVVVVTSAGVFGLSLRDGTEQWQRDLSPATVESATGYGEELASPVAADNHVFCPTANGVVALTLNDGSVAWRASDLASAGVPAVADNGLVVPTTEGLTMLDARDGSPVWTDSADARLPAVTDGTIVTGGEQTVALDAATGERQWIESADSPTYPVVVDETVYLGTGRGLVGRALSDGSERWRIDRGRFIVPPVVTPESVYAVERPGEAGDATFAFDRVANGPPEPRWCSEVGEGAVTSATEDALFTLQDDGLVAFTAAFGDAEWQYSPRGGLQPPAVLDGGAVSVSTDGVVAGIGGE